LRTIAQVAKTQLPYNQPLAHSFVKPPGVALPLFFVLSFAVSAFLPLAFAQTQSTQQLDVASIEGRLRNSSGQPVAGASVFLEDKGHATPTQTQTLARAQTKEDGSFALAGLHPGVYSLRAEKVGLQSAAAASVVLSRGERKHIDLVLDDSKSPSGTMQLADKPDFTVAGVTDGTDIGGHGSDTNMRTSEALARETAAFKSGGASGTAVPATPENREAENRLRAALAAAPGDFEANHQLGEFYFRSRRYAEATPLLQAAYQVNSADFANAYDLALAYRANGDFARAREHARNLLVNARKAEVYRLLGDLDEQLGDPLEAVREYESAAHLEPSEQNYFNWGTELLLHKAQRPAVEVFTKGNVAYPTSARILAGLGAALYANGSYTDAARRLCDASDLNPADPVPYVFLGRMVKAAPDPFPCAEEKLSRFARIQSANALANYYYAVALWKSDRDAANAARKAQVAALLEKAVSLDPKLDEAYIQLGIISSASGENARAISAYKKAIEANPQSGEAHYRLGLAYKRMGEDAKAHQELQLYKQIDRTETAAVERQRRELRQFLIILKDQPPQAAPQ
jgi:tetratricopeptide (TPR) repeat protein